MTAGRTALLAVALTLPGLAATAAPAAAQEAGRPVTLADLHRIRDVGDPRVSPEGDWVAYTVSRADTVADENDTDLWMTRWDGSRTVQLTHSDESEWSPRWSPDGRWLAFLSGRDEDAEGTQVWLMSREGGEAERITDFPGGVSDLAWSPESRRLALVVHDPEPDEGEEDEEDEEDGDPDPPEADSARPDPVDADTLEDEEDEDEQDEDEEDDEPEPIVIDRFYFKEDGAGFLRHRRDHIHVLDVESRESFQLTDGDYDDHLPAWSPDGESLAFVSKRGPDPDRTTDTNLFVVDADSGATPRRITSFEGRDGGSWYGGPVWSPDGERIAYTRGERPELMWYGIWELAVVPAEGGEPTVLTAGLDRNVQTPVWSEDGSSLTFLVEDDRTNWLARMPASGGEIRRLLEGRCYVSAFSAGPDGRIALLKSTPGRPGEVWALEDAAGPVPCGDGAAGGGGGGSSGGSGSDGGSSDGDASDGGLRPLSSQNDAWLAEVRLAPVEEIDFESPDGTRVGGFLVRPLEGAAATTPSAPHPTLLRLHGGPVWQFFNDFFFEWQLMAARGYAVVAPNPRGSSGRGEDFQKAIFADWGNLDGQDVLAAVDHVVEMGVADPERLGVGGWSYGGILTNALIVQDDRFGAAISGAGMGNMLAGYGHDQYVREWETELGAPWENPELWIELSAPFLRADRIETPTLFMCGQEDWNVPLIASEQMYQALRSLGVETRLVVYPGEDHGISRPSFQTDRLRRYLDWYDRFLRPETTAASGS